MESFRYVDNLLLEFEIKVGSRLRGRLASGRSSSSLSSSSLDTRRRPFASEASSFIRDVAPLTRRRPEDLNVDASDTILRVACCASRPFADWQAGGLPSTLLGNFFFASFCSNSSIRSLATLSAGSQVLSSLHKDQPNVRASCVPHARHAGGIEIDWCPPRPTLPFNEVLSHAVLHSTSTNCFNLEHILAKIVFVILPHMRQGQLSHELARAVQLGEHDVQRFSLSCSRFQQEFGITCISL